MKHTILIAVFILITSCSFSQKEKQETTSEITRYYFIRHAEKDRSNPSEKNPHLNADGLKRAENWNKILEHIKFSKVYSSDYIRTKETAQPTADKNNVKLTIYQPNPKDIDAFKTENLGKTVLIVGHSNTIPSFVNAIIGEQKYEDIEDDNNGNLYIVTIVGDKNLDQVLTIN
ncbi:MAG: SixA phosphatase family protein [Aquaticitalea sp.]